MANVECLCFSIYTTHIDPGKREPRSLDVSPLSQRQTCNVSVFLSISHEIRYKFGHLPKKIGLTFKSKKPTFYGKKLDFFP